MSEIVINLALIILASMYFGVIVGRQGNRKAFDDKVQEATEKAQQQAKQQQTELAAELHGELSKIRESIIGSAQAYQSVVKAVGEKLGPADSASELLTEGQQGQLPLFPETSASLAESIESSIVAEAAEEANGSDAQDTLPSARTLEEKAQDEQASEDPTEENETVESETVESDTIEMDRVS